MTIELDGPEPSVAGVVDPAIVPPGIDGDNVLPPDKLLSREDWHRTFVGLLGLAASTGHLVPPGGAWASLTVDEDDIAGKACADAIYDTVLEVPALHFLLRPEATWVGRVIAIGSFAIGHALAFRVEFRARRQSQLAD